MITQEDVDKAWEAWDKVLVAREAWDKTLVARDRARNKVLVARNKAWDKAWDRARELERKFKEQESLI